MYTAQEKREREAFRQLEASLPYTMGEVTVICPICWQVVRTYETKVNDLNRYAFKYDSVIYRDADGSLRTKQMYTSVERNSRGCDHVKPEPIAVKQELAPLPSCYVFEDIVFESNIDDFDF